MDAADTTAIATARPNPAPCTCQAASAATATPHSVPGQPVSALSERRVAPRKNQLPTTASDTPTHIDKTRIRIITNNTISQIGESDRDGLSPCLQQARALPSPTHRRPRCSDREPPGAVLAEALAVDGAARVAATGRLAEAGAGAAATGVRPADAKRGRQPPVHGPEPGAESGWGQPLGAGGVYLVRRADRRALAALRRRSGRSREPVQAASLRRAPCAGSGGKATPACPGMERSLKTDTVRARCSACSRRLWAAAALSSTSAAFCCVI